MKIYKIKNLEALDGTLYGLFEKENDGEFQFVRSIYGSPLVFWHTFIGKLNIPDRKKFSLLGGIALLAGDQVNLEKAALRFEDGEYICVFA